MLAGIEALLHRRVRVSSKARSLIPASCAPCHSEPLMLIRLLVRQTLLQILWVL